ncbi:MAG TPA: hypothetical protein VGX95_05120 [Xanthobacteraceae bacterium]|nr:hypothetical protein [Xanthobacteraceae bacterium]
MSYLNNTRLVFSGTFQADVSTVNNDVRHYDNAHWEARFQDFQKSDTEDGWWNPIGSGAFRLINCRVTGVHYQDGTGATSAAQDPAVGLIIGGANERVAAKIVDLDPQWQMASQIWGLEVRLTAGKEPPLAHGRFLPSAFRDLTFTRIHTAAGDGGPPSATFQSVLEGIAWSAEADNSRALRELKQTAASGTLSMRLMTFAYVTKYGDPRFSLGKVCGAIGPYLANEPKTFVPGRRFVAADAALGQSWNGVNYFTAAVDEASATLLLDLGNALQLTDTNGTMRDIGKLTVGILLDPSLAEKAPVTPANYQVLGEIDYRVPNWLFATSGICAVRLGPAQLQKALAAPLALAAEDPAGTNLIAIRENANGLSSCAEEFVQRIDSPAKSSLVIYTAQYGKPLPGAKVLLSLQPPQSGVGGGDPTAPNQPKAAVPDIGTPPEAVSLPASVTAGADGRASVEIVVKPLSNPRKYLDGQIYLIGYAIDGEPPNAHPQFELIVVHARDSYAAPAKPAWIPDIAPIFTQYGNLYPIMSQRLVDLSNPESVKRNLKILQLAFSLDIDDPNYMPVTRDLSAGKRAAIGRWLDRLGKEDDPTFTGGPRVRSELVAGAEAAAAAVAAAATEAVDGKTAFARSLRRNRGAAE